MARVDIPIGTAVNTAGTIWAAGTINVTDGAEIAVQSWVGHLTLLIENSGSAGTVLVKEGDLRPAYRSGLGDVAVLVPRLGSAFLTIEGSRHVQDDGKIYIDFANSGSADIAGNIYAVRQAHS